MKKGEEASVIGSGPNGLAAAITLQSAGCPVTLYEAKESIGGGMRTQELTLPGFHHDVCSAIHPLAKASPFFRTLPLQEYGLEWIQPQTPLAHPFDDGSVVLLERSIEETSLNLEQDSLAYKNLMQPLVQNWSKTERDILAPLHIPHRPVETAKFGIKALRSASYFARKTFQGKKARALFAGLAAHSMLPLNWSITSGFGLVLAILGHVAGWPFPKGGSQKLADALAGYFTSLGGKIITNFNVESLEQLPNNHLFFDLTPRQLLAIAEERFPYWYTQKLNNYRYGAGVLKIDWALKHPIPWKSADCFRAGTVHLGGTIEEIEKSESEVWENKLPEKPFVLLAQQSLFDPTRAPGGMHTAWGYCHVPSGSIFDMTERIESQIERFAPGFRDCILAKSIKNPSALESYNANYIGGDINGGVQDFSQLFARPILSFKPYLTPAEGIYICSSSTPPGGGVHGMCGHLAALAALDQG